MHAHRLLAPLLLAPAALAQPCAPRWQGLAVNAEAHTLFIDAPHSASPSLLIGGAFTAPIPYLARLAGTTLLPVAPGLEGDVLTITRHDDGSGSTLYVAGFVNVPHGAWTVNYARLERGAFRSFGGLDGPNTWAGHLAGYDFGQGPKILASGGFGFPCEYVTQWNGSTWECLALGLGSVINDSVLFDDGHGPELFCAGSFVVNGMGGDTQGVAKWNGSRWAPVGGGLNGYAEACLLHDDGSGTELFIAGGFSRVGGFPGVNAVNITKWNGSRWAPLAAGTDRTVTALAAFDDGSGLKLYAAGEFTRAGAAAVQHLARWDGAAWSPCPAGGVPAGTVNDMAAFDPDGPGPAPAVLALAGLFSSVGGAPASNLALLHPAAPSADFNHDGFTDFFDYDAYVEAFESGAPAADFNHDAFLDLFDYTDFLTAFEQGC